MRSAPDGVGRLRTYSSNSSSGGASAKAFLWCEMYGAVSRKRRQPPGRAPWTPWVDGGRRWWRSHTDAALVDPKLTQRICQVIGRVRVRGVPRVGCRDQGDSMSGWSRVGDRGRLKWSGRNVAGPVRYAGERHRIWCIVSATAIDKSRGSVCGGTGIQRHLSRQLLNRHRSGLIWLWRRRRRRRRRLRVRVRVHVRVQERRHRGIDGQFVEDAMVVRPVRIVGETGLARIGVVAHAWRYALQLEPDAGGARPRVRRGGIAFDLSPPTAFTCAHH